MTWRSLKHWFTNSFWYHYKWHAIGILAAALMIFFFVWEMTHKEVPDMNYAVVVENLAGETQLDEINRLAGEILGDRNEDGQTVVYHALLTYGDPSLEIANRQRFPIIFIDDSYQLIFMDEINFAQDSWDDTFTPWAEVGLSVAGESPYALDVSGWPVFARARLTDGPLYACLKQLDEKALKDSDAVRLWESSVAFIKALQEMT